MNWAWWPWAGAMTVLLLVLTVVTWRKRGAGTGLKLLGVSLLPMAAILLGLQHTLRLVVTAVWDFIRQFVGITTAWIGLGMAALGVLLYLLGGAINARQLSRARGNPPGAAADGARPAVGPAGSRARTASSQDKNSDGDDDLSDVEEILRRRGIS
jgi:hypothetical protein